MPLVLTRHPMQSIHIGDDIVVTVVSIDMDRKTVRIAIEAPRSVAIVREELLKSRQRTRGSVMQSFKARMKLRQQEEK